LNTYGSRVPDHWTPRFEPADYEEAPIPAGVDLRAGGTPDVFGFRDDSLVFVELKRHPDRLTPEQVAWFENAIAGGVPLSGLLVATWTGQA
jgi:VRR-NUC domain